MIGRFGLLIAISTSACASSAKQPPPPSHSVRAPTAAESLSWLCGTWALSRDELFAEEIWGVDGERLVGRATMTEQGKEVFFENLQIEGAGQRTQYLASPNGRQPPTPFDVTLQTDSSVVFENQAHDFPRRISYTRNGKALDVQLSGVEEGVPREERFTYDLFAPCKQ